MSDGKIHYIYKIHFLKGFPAGRYYIGKRTFNGKDLRKDNYSGSGNFCFAYFKKYGKLEGETYIKEILEINPSREINENRELFLIGDLWETDNLCMNQKPGGNGGCGKGSAASRWGQKWSKEQHDKMRGKNKYNCAKAVCQYDVNGELVAKYKSISDAARCLGIGDSGIVGCCLGRKHYNSCAGYFWRYEDDHVLDFKSTKQKYSEQKAKTKERNRLKREAEKQEKINKMPYIVDKYDLDGNFIESFKTYIDAAKSCGSNISHGIVKCCKRVSNYNTALGYIWRFHGEDLGEIPKNICYKAVGQIDSDGNLIKLYNKISDAERELGINHSSIIRSCNTGIRAGGYNWKYVCPN